MPTPTKILDRVKVREVASVYRARDAMDEAVTALLREGARVPVPSAETVAERLAELC